MSICLVFLPPAFSCLPDLLSVLFLIDPPLSLFSSNCSLLSGCPTLILLSFRLISYFSNRPRPLPFLICSSHFLLSPIHNATFIFLIFSSFRFPFIFSVPLSILLALTAFLCFHSSWPLIVYSILPPFLPTFSSHSLLLSQGGILSSNHFLWNTLSLSLSLSVEVDLTLMCQCDRTGLNSPEDE